MKRALLIFLFFVVAFLIIFLLFNFYDAYLKESIFTRAHLKPSTWDKRNGFYILWGLSEKPEVDVQSDEYVNKIRNIFKSEETFKQFDYGEFKKKFSPYSEILANLVYPNRPFLDDWISVMKPQVEKVEEALGVCDPLVKRYEKLINSDIFEDFTPLRIDSPIPNLLAWLRVTKLYTVMQTTKAITGNWEDAAFALLAQIHFGKKAVANSKYLIITLIAKALICTPLEGIVSILNQPGCPKSVYRLILEGLPPLKPEEYGTRNAFIAECLIIQSLVDDIFKKDYNYDDIDTILPITPFLHKDRTKNYFIDCYSMLIDWENRAPYTWREKLFEKSWLIMKAKGSFWWFQNPLGKILYDEYCPNLNLVICKSYRLRAFYEMSRILAEFRLKYSDDRSAISVFNELETYTTLDPGSGKPYRWDPGKKLLYSIGVDGKDNGGTLIENSFNGNDFAIPVVIKNTKEN